MVSAIDVRTFGLGGDSAVRFEREEHDFVVATHRVMPLSLLIHKHPELLTVLEAQLALPRSTSHSAQFVMIHSADPVDLSYQQRELYEQIRQGPKDVQSLFGDQTLERALRRLEQRGIVLRAGFTPSDATHITGKQSTWNIQGAVLGARLLMRYSADNLGPKFEDEGAFAHAICEQVARRTAVSLLDAAVASGSAGSGLTASQKALLQSSFNESGNTLVSLQAKLHLPIVGLGAPVRSYYPRVAEVLGTRAVLPKHASVANAIGAVVGTVRQQQVIVISPAGGQCVSVMFPDGPQRFETLEEGASEARKVAMRLASARAMQAGARDPTVSCQRDDVIVEQGAESVFFESQITATAVGRPARFS
jgi:N-methylhydantoinase A/oxoprolinase/acetone carboxylase beta subunit